MNKSSTHKTAPHGGKSKSECCTDAECESGLRNHYFPGKRLTADSFRVEQGYHVERRRLLNRAIHGWGVVYGYALEAASPSDCDDGPGSGRLRIGPGLALDECGRELLQVATVRIVLDDLIFLDEDGGRTDAERAGAHPNPGGCWLLSVHYAERHVGPVTVDEPCSCKRDEHDHTCEAVRYSLRPIDCDDCCRDFECELQCGCGSGRCCDEPAPADDPERHHPGPPPECDKPPGRGGCRCLCDHLTRFRPRDECGPLCEIEEPCGRVWVDLRHGVPLACVELERDDCDRWAFGAAVEACGPRRLVKRNDLLFDLIRGCDLTRIVEIGWSRWHRREAPVPFDDFSRGLGPDGDHEAEYVTNDFWVRFSRPVREDTLRPDCFAITVISGEREGGWWQTLRVPIVRVDTTMVPPEPDDPPGHVRSARLVVDGAWLEDGVRGRRSLFLDCDTLRVELEVRGDFIVDCNGQPVDANASGLCPAPTGNGTPGGTFLSTFRVAAAREAPARDTDQTEGRRKGASS